MEPPQKLKKVKTESVPLAGTSQSDFPSESMDSEFVDTLNECETVSSETKEEITGAVYYCMELLEKMDIINKTRSTVTSNRSKIMGQEMAKEVLNAIHGGEFVEETELLAAEEKCESHTEIASINIEHAIEESPSSPEKSEDKPERDSVPFELKLKAVRLSELHPKWSIKTLATKTTRKLTSRVQLWRWKNYVKSGGTKFEKYQMIDTWVYDRFQEARNNAHFVTTRTLRLWAMAAAGPLLSESFQFQASQTWADTFKVKHRIRQRHVTKLVSTKEKRTFEELLRTAAEFQHQTSTMIPHFDPDFVINTDQTGCEYRISSDRTLSFRAEKVTEIAVSQLNQLTHSYTAQYGLTLSGKLLPTVFISLQEPTGKFSPRVQQEVNQLLERHQNVCVTATNSGKLTKETYNQFLDKVLHPYVKTEPFLFITDSWGGQSEVSLYDGKFVDEDGMPTCSLKVIPLNCTPLCQPCDVYFYQQVKNYIRRLQNCSFLIAQQRDITTRSDTIKIHALIHNQFQAPIFEKMIRYAWFAAKLTPDREIFNNVNEVAFPEDIHTKKCDCGKSAFVRCSWCTVFLCFECFYDRYHPEKCTGFS